MLKQTRPSHTCSPSILVQQSNMSEILWEYCHMDDWTLAHILQGFQKDKWVAALVKVIQEQ